MISVRILAGYVLGVSQLSTMMEETKANVSHRLQQTLVQPLYDFDPVSVEKALRAEFLQREVSGLYVWLDDYTTLFKGVVRKGEEIKTIDSFTSMKLQHFIRFPIVHISSTGKKITIGVVDLYLDEKPARNNLVLELFRDLIFSAGSILVLLILVGFLVDQNLLTPFEFLRQWMVEIASIPEGRYDSSVEKEHLSSVYPEIEQMYSTFSSLLKSVQHKQDIILDSEERYRTLVENAPEGIVVIDTERLKLVDVNDQFLDIIGYDRNTVYSMNVEDFSPDYQPLEKQTPEVLTRYLEMASRGCVVIDEWCLKHAEGDLIPCDLRLTPMAGTGDKPLIRASVNDISDRKNSEKKMQLLRLYLQNIVDRMPSAIVGVNSGGIVTLWNDEAVRITSVLSKDIVGRRLLVEFSNFRAIKDEVEAVLRNSTFISLKKVRMSFNDDNHYYDVIIFPIENDEGPAAIIRLDDITERMRMEGLMLQSEKMISLAGLAAGMAHEINNPLGGIINAEQNIRRRLEAGKKANESLADELGISMETITEYVERRGVLRSLGMIRESGLRAADIVKNMLQFSRNTDSSKTLVDLKYVIEDTIQLGYSDYDLKKKYDFKYVQIDRQYDDYIPRVWCCPGEIEQVILNLLKNGVQAMNQTHSEGFTPHFIIRLLRDDRYVTIEVEDNGPGIPEDVRNRVFEPFFTTKAVGIGSGLGLAVSFMIITQNHHGIMEVDSVVGEGATFKVRLPIGKDDKS